MSGTSDKLRRRWPEFSDHTVWPDETIDEVYLPEAVLLHNKCKWLSLWELAIIHYCAHIMSIAGPPVQLIPGGGGATTAAQTASGGILSSFKTGSISESYFNTSGGGGSGAIQDANLNDTPYGKQYLELKKRIFPGSPLFR